jgi:hypothetical protein
VQIKIQSTGPASEESVITLGEDANDSIGESTTSTLKELREYITRSLSAFVSSHPARVPPIAPGPMRVILGIDNN